MYDRLSLRTLPIIPDVAVELEKELCGSDKKYSLTVDCPNCYNSIPLSDIPVEWPVGSERLYFGRIPGYQCKVCDIQYFPREALELLLLNAQKEANSLHVPFPKQYPRGMLPLS